MKGDISSVEEFCEKNRIQPESRLQYFKRVLAKVFTYKSWIMYRDDRFIFRDKEGNLALYQKIQDGKNEDTSS